MTHPDWPGAIDVLVGKVNAEPILFFNPGTLMLDSVTVSMPEEIQRDWVFEFNFKELAIPIPVTVENSYTQEQLRFFPGKKRFHYSPSDSLR